MTKTSKKKSWIGFAVAVSIVVIAMMRIVDDFDPATARDSVRSHGVMGMLTFTLVGILMISTVAPKTVISVSAGAMYGTLGGTLVILVIATTAAWINYWIGRRWRCRTTAAARSDAPDCWLIVLREMAAEAHLGAHLLVRLSPIPTMVIGYSMGAFQAKLKPYLAAAMLAAFPQAAWVHSGSSAILLGTPDESDLTWLSSLVSIGVAVMMSVLVPREAIRRLRKRSDEPDTPPNPNQPTPHQHTPHQLRPCRPPHESRLP
ncbi:MAG: TVP38/TMEM64 family protein [Novipirellula sp. JB048]